MNKKVKSFLTGGISCLLLVLLDQFTKRLAVLYLMDKKPKILIDGVFEMRYLENRGAAFGMFQNQQIFFYIITVVILAGIFYCYGRLPVKRRYLPLKICAVGLTAGAIGNFIDRFVQGYVIDFLYFSLINFPVFNVADCYVTIFTALLAYLILFVYKDEDFLFFNRKKKENAA